MISLLIAISKRWKWMLIYTSTSSYQVIKAIYIANFGHLSKNLARYFVFHLVAYIPRWLVYLLYFLENVVVVCVLPAIAARLVAASVREPVYTSVVVSFRRHRCSESSSFLSRTTNSPIYSLSCLRRNGPARHKLKKKIAATFLHYDHLTHHLRFLSIISIPLRTVPWQFITFSIINFLCRP